MEDLTGKQFGHYQIVAPLGEGGMATVYKAYQPSMERHVAIKVLPRHLASSDDFLKRFEREAKLLAKLQHQNILPVFDYGESDGYPYIVMPYVPSGTLAELIGTQQLSLTQTLRIITQIGDALAYAHSRGMIHRDIKPSNVLIDESNNCHLTDFGLARMVESSIKITTSGTVLGTPAYMSPEQGQGSEIDHRSDIYSLGIILYEMVTGRVPYNAETPIAVVFKHIQDPLPSARKLNPDLPEAVELVLLKALAKSPEDRYQSMEEFIQAVHSAIPEAPMTEKTVDRDTVTESQADKTKVASTMRSTEPQKSKTGVMKYILIGFVALVLIVGGVWGALRLAGLFINNQNSESFAPAEQPPVQESDGQNPTEPPNPAPPSEPDCFSEDVFCVGLVTDVGKINDRSFNESAWEGVAQAEGELGAIVNFIETNDPRDYEKNISTFGDAGYDVIVTVGFGMGEATTFTADRYPETMFIGVDQFQDPERIGVVGLNFPEDQAGFLVGALAAMMSESHKVGAVCGTDSVPPVWRFGEGYRAGAEYADQIRGTRTEVLVVYHNDVGFDRTFTDPEWGAVTAKSMMDQGVDVIFGCGGITGNGAITAAALEGKYAIGVDTDQFYTLPEAAPRMLSSAMKLITPGVFELIVRAREGSFPSGNYFGPAGYAPYHDTDGEVPDDVKAEMEKIHEGLLNGSIQTGLSVVPPFECTDAIGCVDIAPDEPIHIAYMLTISGATAFLGEDSQGAVEIAIDDRGGQLLGHDILLTGEDSLCSAEGGQTAATKVAADPTIVGVIGTNCSAAATAAMPTISNAGLVMISPSNTAPALTIEGQTYQPGYFRVCHTDLFQGAVAAEFAYNELGARTLATIHDGSPYADQLQEVTAGRFQELGGTVTFQGAINVGDTDMRTILTSIAPDSPDALYFPVFEPEGPFIVAQSSEIAGLENTKLIGADGLLANSFPENSGPNVVGMYLSGPYVSGADYNAFLGKWDAKFGGVPPSGFHAFAYDGTNILFDAIEAVAFVDADGTIHIGRQALRDAITRTDTTGLSGNINCGDKIFGDLQAHGDCATGDALGIFEITQAELDGNWPPPVVYTP